MSAPDQQDSHSYVTSAAITFPVTISAASNDQIEYNELEYLIPAGVYATPAALCAALNACTNDEDNTGPTLPTLISWKAESAAGVTNKIRARAIVKGVCTLAFGTGAENDGLASIGITDGWLISRTKAGADTPATSAQNTVNASGVYWDGDKYASNDYTLV